MLKLKAKGQNSKIQRKNPVRLDKIKYLYPIVADGGLSFLSRPRRSDKSRLNGASKEIPKGGREPAKGFFNFSPQEEPLLTGKGAEWKILSL
jgi:hypothetical protein